MPDILYGRQPVREALRAGRRKVHRLLLMEGARPTPALEELRVLAGERGASIESGPKRELDRITHGAHHQGVALAAEAYPYTEFNVRRSELSDTRIVLLLDHVQDPQNLGSVLRTADAAGVALTVVPTRRAAHVTPAVVRASSGATEHLDVCLVPNVVQAMRALKDEGFWLAGLDASAEAQPYTAVDLTGKVGLVLGSEGHGLSRLVAETCDFKLRLPMHGAVNSLNAGVAAGIALYEILRQRKPA